MLLAGASSAIADSEKKQAVIGYVFIRIVPFRF
jgi:hypothetical protein